MPLYVRNLNAAYGDLTVLSNININLEDNQVVSLVGTNASGKSTLINCISGIIRQKTGEIVFNDVHLENSPPNRIVELGIVQVPEGRHVFPFMSVLENILVGAHLPGPKKNIKQNMEIVFDMLPKLKDRRNQMAGSLSGGEQQMLAIGRALMSEPQVLMMDEPTLGLAPIIVDTVFDLIYNIRKMGKSVLLIEQNVQHALDISDYAYVISNGTITMEGKGKALLHDENLITSYMGI